MICCKVSSRQYNLLSSYMTLTVMYLFVRLERVGLCEGHVALVTLVRLLSGVSAEMTLELERV